MPAFGDALPMRRAPLPGRPVPPVGEVDPEDWRPAVEPYAPPAHMRLPSEIGGTGHAKPDEQTCVLAEQHILNGASIASAKSAVGIKKHLWLKWLEHARAEKEPYATFVARLEYAKAYSERHFRGIIAAGAVHPDARVAVPAALESLKILSPQRYATRTASRVDANVNGKMETALTAVEESDLLRAAADVLTSRGDDDLADLIRARLTT